MAERKLLTGAGTASAIGVRVARSLYSRWRALRPPERQRLAPLAEDAKSRALALRGVADRPAAERKLRTANESLAAALVEAAEADPDLSESEVGRLRDELRGELDRLASGEIRAFGRAGRHRSRRV